MIIELLSREAFSLEPRLAVKPFSLFDEHVDPCATPDLPGGAIVAPGSTTIPRESAESLPLDFANW